MENRFAPLAGQAEYIIGALRDTEADLRVRLAEAIQNENKSKATLAAVKRIAKDDKLVLTDEVKKIKRKTDAQIEKKQFLEWELRAQIDTVAKQGTVSLATQRAVMVDDAKTKMTELVLDKLMEDPSRNPTLAGKPQPPTLVTHNAVCSSRSCIHGLDCRDCGREAERQRIQVWLSSTARRETRDSPWTHGELHCGLQGICRHGNSRRARASGRCGGGGRQARAWRRRWAFRAGAWMPAVAA